MAYTHPKLAYAIGWKFNHQQGMETSGGGLTSWPTQPWPTDQELAGYVAEYEAYLASTQCKDDELANWMDSRDGKVIKAIVLVGQDKGLWTLAELRQKYRGL